MTESDEVLVASTHSGETTFSSAAKTSCLTDSSSKTASMTKSASGEGLQRGRAGHQGLEPVGLVLVDPALAPQCVDLPVHPGDAGVDALLVEVAQDDRHLEPLHEEQGELAGHQARSDDADRRDRPGQRGVRARPPAAWPGAAPGRRRRRRCAARRCRSGRRAPRPRPRSPRRGLPCGPAAIRSRARYGAGAAPCSRASDLLAGRRNGTVPGGLVAARRPRARRRPRRSSTSAAQRSDSSRKSAGSNITSAMPSSNALGPLSIRFWLSGLLDDDLERVAARRPGWAAGRCRPSRGPGRGSTRAGRRRRRRRRSCGRSQCSAQLDAAAHRRAVDEGEGRHGDAELAEAAQLVVAGPGDRQGLVAASRASRRPSGRRRRRR